MVKVGEAWGEDREECSWDLHKSEFCRLGAVCAEGLLCNPEGLQKLEVLLLLIFPQMDTLPLLSSQVPTLTKRRLPQTQPSFILM